MRGVTTLKRISCSHRAVGSPRPMALCLRLLIAAQQEQHAYSSLCSAVLRDRLHDRDLIAHSAVFLINWCNCNELRSEGHFVRSLYCSTLVT